MAVVKLTRALVLLVLIIMARPALARAPLDVETSPTEVNLTPYLEVYEDPYARFGVEDLRHDSFNAQFEPLKRESANFGFSSSDWWVRFSVRNSGDRYQNLTFKLDYPLLDHVDVWVLSGGRVIRTWETGNRQPFSSRAVEHRDFLFPLALAGDEEQTVYLRVRTKGPVNIGLTLFGHNTLLPTIELEYMVFGAYFGGFILLALCISLLYLMDRQVAFLYYLTYIVSYSSYMMAFNGLAFQYLWPEAPEFGQISRPILLTLSIIFLLQFCRSLLGIERVSAFLHRCVTGLQCVLVGVLIAVPVVGYGVLVEPLAIFLLLALVLVLAMGLVAHMKGEPAAKYYLWAWSVFLGGVFIYLLKVFGVLPHNFVTHYGFQIGSFFEFVFLSIALGVRVRELRIQSNVDGLTGLANRRHFDRELTSEFRLSDRPEAELCLMVLDVDHFKDFNDKHGHPVGDKVLKELALVLKKQIRRPGTAFRYGGEEFAVLLPRTDLDEARVLAERLRTRISKDVPFDDVTVSIGVVSRRDGSFDSSAEFFNAGDKALYLAKNTGRNRVAIYRTGMKSFVDARQVSPVTGGGEAG
ncbi:7TM diverse intracellular signaling domain-containing protein [Kordiimonas sp.]|uniref:7TM diverse intracellular signaling domain-containing protein n=1 Tax=Kordiimonas sp. TaxID=1970157 RepID=UPI003A911209